MGYWLDILWDIPSLSTFSVVSGLYKCAVTEDANRSIELKNGSTVGGRKIGVKHAMHRAPLEQRRSKGNQGCACAKFSFLSDLLVKGFSQMILRRLRNDKADLSSAIVKQKQASKSQETESSKTTSALSDTADGARGSEKQRVARTVILGGLLNTEMAKDVHNRARECGTVCSVTYPLPKEELEHYAHMLCALCACCEFISRRVLKAAVMVVNICSSVLTMCLFLCQRSVEVHGLARDGCKMDASSVLYTSVRSARACVTALHQKEISGGFVWARQQGGEATVSEIKDMFSPAGFVWDVFIPANSETGVSKGFAFVKFTSKQEAESAIQKFNGKKFGKRPIAVDWAVPKKVYATGSHSVVASEDGQDNGNEKDDDGSSDDLEDSDVDSVEDTQQPDGAFDDSDMIEKGDVPPKFDFDEEADVARKVLNSLISSSTKGIPTSGDGDSNQPSGSRHDESNVPDKPSDGSVNVSGMIKPENSGKIKLTNLKAADGEDDLRRTIFISNLPFDIDNEEVKQRFSGYGEVQSFIPVLHQVTKRPRGTGFLKFKTFDAADAAFSAADTGTGLGIFLKGRQLKVLKALDKKSAQNKELEKSKKEDHDHRNLYLAKEGLIVEGTPAAEGVSAGDMSKRQTLDRKKMVKLQSPNFHVSRTRLIMYNLPKSMTEKELKQLCIDAVTSRATKQKPVIRQIKFLKDSKKGEVVKQNHSRGVAFLEFTEHQHALVALRVLNNNPETFGPEHRPIVEFALDNVQTLKLRTSRLQAQQQSTHDDADHVQENNDVHPPDGQPNMKSRKRKVQGDVRSLMSSKTRKEDETDNKLLEGVAAEEGRPIKKQVNDRRRGNRNKFSSEGKEERSKQKVKPDQRGRNPEDQKPLQGENKAVNARKMEEEVGSRKKKRTFQERIEQQKERKKAKRNKDPLGRGCSGQT
ncbi:RNA-binding (RRM/RBD/RNP motifs) family protein [Actinidia rufa]|uniref:RNA-binding (RRM/RBD/RNP motifs) family protein n=1 Tax=Actinidia rufa TaxID=165716 RepID=A0A7J0F6U4_9ERIC|nr:RNA-binding (RRM/RBD/RNP motifs) family protein [Actinidia rufa]